MKKVMLIIILLLILMPIKIESININSECFILMDSDSGRILTGKNIHRQRLIASITKIMTAVIAIESNKMNDLVKIDETILKSYGSNIYIEINEIMSLRDLIYGLMLKSGNDAAMMIAHHLSGSEEEFAKLMNNKAKELGMNNTIFRNPHGLDEETENYSTAYDIALLTKYAMTLDEYRKIVGTKKHYVKTNYKTYEWVNKNQLLFSYKYTTGGKNGYTERANRTLVTTASKDNLNLIVVTLNESEHWGVHKYLHDYGFANYKNYKIISKNNFRLVDEYFYKDKLFVKNDYYYPLKEKEKDSVYTKAKIIKFNNYDDHTKVGEIEIYLNDEKIHTQNVYVRKIKRKWNIFRWLINLFI